MLLSFGCDLTLPLTRRREPISRCQPAQRSGAALHYVTVLRQIPDQVVGDALLEQDASGRDHGLAELRIPRCRLRRPGKRDMLRMDPYPADVVAGVHPPWLGAGAAQDPAGDGQPRPGEATVVAQLTAAADDTVRELVKRGRRPPFGAQQGRRARAQLRGGVA